MMAPDQPVQQPPPQKQLHNTGDCLKVAEIALFLFLIIITLSSFIWYGVRSIQREALRFDSSQNHWSSNTGGKTPFDHLYLRGSEKGKADNDRKAKEAAAAVNAYRAAFVVNLTLEAWTAYQTAAWGFDALQPDSRSGMNLLLLDHHQHHPQRTSKSFSSWQQPPQHPNIRLGRTLVTAMSTLWVMGLRSQFALARHWVGSRLHFSSSGGDHHHHNQNLKLNVAEAVQQYLGSFLSLYALTGDRLFFEKALELTSVLAPAYRTGTGVPYAWIHMGSGSGSSFPEGRVGYPGQALGQLLEYVHFGRLLRKVMMGGNSTNRNSKSQFSTENLQRRASRYQAAIRRYLAPPNSALHLDRISADDYVPVSSRLTCLAWTDGPLIAGLLKTFLLTELSSSSNHENREREKWALDAFNGAIDEAGAEGVISRDQRFLHLLSQCSEQWSATKGARNPFDPSTMMKDNKAEEQKTTNEKIGHFGRENQTTAAVASMKSLSCHFGGLLSLAANALERQQQQISKEKAAELSRRTLRYSKLAAQLTESCHRAAMATVTSGLPPAKFAHFTTGSSAVELVKNTFSSLSSSASANSSQNLYTKMKSTVPPLITEEGSFLGPELAESYFLLWRQTGDPRYREWAWSYALALHRYARSPNGGFSQIASTKRELPPPRTNYQPPHLMAATLKYLYLTFVDKEQQLPLDQWVFNEAGQPLPVWTE